VAAYVLFLCDARCVEARADYSSRLHTAEGRGFNSLWCHWNLLLTSFRPHYGPGVDSASNRNEYQEYVLGVKAAGA